MAFLIPDALIALTASKVDAREVLLSLCLFLDSQPAMCRIADEIDGQLTRIL
jgi:hypothetical protein